MSLPTNFFIGRGAADSYYTQLDITINATRSGSGYNTAIGGSLAQYQNAATGNNDPTTTIISRLGDGILVVPAKAGIYDVTGRGAQGSGGNHAEGRSITAGTLTLSSDVTLLILIGNNGTGNYSAGGGTFIATANSEENPTHTDMTAADAVLVLGGGAGGYSQFITRNIPGPLTTSLSTAEARIGYTNGTYDEGAGFLNSYTPLGDGYTSTNTPHHFVQGGRGSMAAGCGSGTGGFGGGGGSCPAGAGGYVGGLKGINSPSQSGGGGGTSYCNSAYMSSFTQSGGSQDNNNYTSFNSNASGFLTITPQ